MSNVLTNVDASNSGECLFQCQNEVENPKLYDDNKRGDDAKLSLVSIREYKRLQWDRGLYECWWEIFELPG